VVITTRKEESLISDLAETFDNLNRYKLKLNPTKCSFGVSAGQLLGLLVSARGIEENPEKIQAILTMGKPTKLHDVQKLARHVAALSRFVASVTSQDFIKFWRNFFAFILHVLIENSQGFKTF
jgi:hypothetical protein